MYVRSKNIEENTVTLCENDGLFSKSLNAVDFNWIADEKTSAPIRIKAKIRYKQTEQWATAVVFDGFKVSWCYCQHFG
jgi:Predicted tRNA(5-methylaminomethyl-2-thiouridylate) methyltransferase, contains the PP-loop ATPase domain